LTSLEGFSQGQLVVGSVFEDFYRREQLLGKLDSSVSFLIRPIHRKNLADHSLKNSSLKLNKDKSKIRLLPLTSRSRYLQKHPYGWNDGSLLPLSGYQQLVSAGFAGKIGILNFQIQPEFHFAQNLDFQGIPLDMPEILWRRYYQSQINVIDTPESFGEGKIEKFYLGQSSIGLEIGPISLGWSNQNLWWGPGMRNSLVMSNNSRGFQHLTLNTNKPVNTPLGSFEFQIIGAKLENSGFDPPRPNLVSTDGNFLFRERDEDWRYLSGITAAYQPKWIKGLSLGFSRVVQQYSQIAKDNNDYLSSFSNFFRNNDALDDIFRDQLASIFMRYFSTKTQSEIYFEFARNDAAFDFRDFFLEPNHAAGYLFGFRKLFPAFQSKSQFFEGGFEWTILSQSSSRIIRNGGTFYVHSQVRHGYTHRGEILGAGIGPSSNSQTLNINWVSGLNKIGLTLERVTRNEDLYIDLFRDIQDFLRPWVDVSAFLNASWQFDNLILEGHFGFIKSLNYQYQIHRTAGFLPGFVDVPNFSAGLNMYLIL